MSNLFKPPRIFILLLMISYATFMAVLFTPALPQIAEYFGISESMAGWTMSIFLVGYALGQLPYGPLAKRYGRKKAVYIGIAVALIGTYLCSVANSFAMLCLGRFIQALGAAAGLKIAFTMTGDTHVGAKATQTISILMLAVGIMPGLAIAIGGFLLTGWPWQIGFTFLIFYSLLLALLCLILPETAHELDKDALQIDKISKGYAHQFKDPFTVYHALLMGLSTCTIYIFATLSPYIGIEIIGLTPKEFGFWNLVPSLGLVLGFYLAGRMAGHTPPRAAMVSGILLVLVGTLAMMISFANQWVHPLSLFFTMFMIQIGNGVSWSFASSKALSEAHDKSNASAVMQFIGLGLATIAVFLISAFSPQLNMLLPLSFFILSALMLFVWLLLKEHHLKRPH